MQTLTSRKQRALLARHELHAQVIIALSTLSPTKNKFQEKKRKFIRKHFHAIHNVEQQFFVLNSIFGLGKVPMAAAHDRSDDVEKKMRVFSSQLTHSSRLSIQQQRLIATCCCDAPCTTLRLLVRTGLASDKHIPQIAAFLKSHGQNLCRQQIGVCHSSDRIPRLAVQLSEAIKAQIQGIVSQGVEGDSFLFSADMGTLSKSLCSLLVPLSLRAPSLGWNSEHSVNARSMPADSVGAAGVQTLLPPVLDVSVFVRSEIIPSLVDVSAESHEHRNHALARAILALDVIEHCYSVLCAQLQTRQERAELTIDLLKHVQRAVRFYWTTFEHGNSHALLCTITGSKVHQKFQHATQVLVSFFRDVVFQDGKCGLARFPAVDTMVQSLFKDVVFACDITDEQLSNWAREQLEFWQMILVDAPGFTDGSVIAQQQMLENPADGVEPSDKSSVHAQKLLRFMMHSDLHVETSEVHTPLSVTILWWRSLQAACTELQCSMIGRCLTATISKIFFVATNQDLQRLFRHVLPSLIARSKDARSPGTFPACRSRLDAPATPGKSLTFPAPQIVAAHVAFRVLACTMTTAIAHHAFADKYATHLQTLLSVLHRDMIDSNNQQHLELSSQIVSLALQFAQWVWQSHSSWAFAIKIVEQMYVFATSALQKLRQHHEWAQLQSCILRHNNRRVICRHCLLAQATSNLSNLSQHKSADLASAPKQNLAGMVAALRALQRVDPSPT